MDSILQRQLATIPACDEPVSMERGGQWKWKGECGTDKTQHGYERATHLPVGKPSIYDDDGAVTDSVDDVLCVSTLSGVSSSSLASFADASRAKKRPRRRLADSPAQSPPASRPPISRYIIAAICEGVNDKTTGPGGAEWRNDNRALCYSAPTPRTSQLYGLSVCVYASPSHLPRSCVERQDGPQATSGNECVDVSGDSKGESPLSNLKYSTSGSGFRLRAVHVAGRRGHCAQTHLDPPSSSQSHSRGWLAPDAAIPTAEDSDGHDGQLVQQRLGGLERFLVTCILCHVYFWSSSKNPLLPNVCNRSAEILLAVSADDAIGLGRNLRLVNSVLSETSCGCARMKKKEHMRGETGRPSALSFFATTQQHQATRSA
uniref:Uncharacterized protein n=1 Tax=Mycena chlorophos TaxID=658473 RepID=A0ABQ0LEP5_MYCCL|nr:predicted protein [Mycena chlorophos]